MYILLNLTVNYIFAVEGHDVEVNKSGMQGSNLQWEVKQPYFAGGRSSHDTQINENFNSKAAMGLIKLKTIISKYDCLNNII